MGGQSLPAHLASAQDGVELVLPGLSSGPMFVLERLATAGHEAGVVGGSLRDHLRGAEHSDDWDVATSAHPEVVAGLFEDSTWENRFGTVTVRASGAEVQVTSYRTEGTYHDRRRPDEVRFGTSLLGDLARRDFTINAIAWVPTDLAARRGRLVDPYGGIEDLRRGVLRAVGDPEERFDEDALRLLRAARFAARFGMEIDPPTERAVRRLAPNAASVSGERVRDELLRILGAGDAPPSHAFVLMERLGLLSVLLPELAALRGVPQAKALPGDALDHSLRTADVLPPSDPVLRLAGLLHDVGKATTLGGGHFYDHEDVGAELAEEILRRLRFPTADVTRVAKLVRRHMFAYEPAWTDAAVRRFIQRVEREHLDSLFALRHADNVASGFAEPHIGGLAELEERVARELSAPLGTRDLAIGGDDLQRELGLTPGPEIGRLLDLLLDAVVEDPRRNEPEVLLSLARAARRTGDGAHHDPSEDPDDLR
jgi:tRNA nucleotidyltransferase (CCA-adding enzyme)